MRLKTPLHDVVHLPFRRPDSFKALLISHSSCPLVLRNSSAAHFSTAFNNSGSRRRTNGFFCAIQFSLLIAFPKAIGRMLRTEFTPLIVQCACIDNWGSVFVATKHHHQVAYHCRFPFLVKLYNFFAAKMLQCHLNHGYRTFYDFVAGCNHSGGLLSPEHSAGDFRSVCEIADACFYDMDTGNVQPVAQVLFKRFVDFFMARPQGEFIVIVEAVIGIHTRQPSYSGIALDAHEVFIIIYLECRLERVLYLPYKDHTDLDGVTHLVVHFDLLTVEITGA